MEQIFTQIPTTIYGWVGLGAVIVAAILWVRNQDVSSLRASNKELREENVYLQAQINELKKSLEQLRLSLQDKQRSIDNLSHITVVSSPDLIAYMSDMRNFTNQVHPWMLEHTKTSGGIILKIEQLASEIKQLKLSFEKK